jgi:hypothetical protein
MPGAGVEPARDFRHAIHDAGNGRQNGHNLERLGHRSSDERGRALCVDYGRERVAPIYSICFKSDFICFLSLAVTQTFNQQYL